MSYQSLRDNLEKAMNADDKSGVPAAKKALTDFTTGKARTVAPEPETRGTFGDYKTPPGQAKPKKSTPRRSTTTPK